jgi:ribA/ribD-fused uncharacterized protein
MIDRFDGDYRFLSNFYTHPFSDGVFIYQTVEHYFQSKKTLVASERDRVLRSPTPKEAKREGRRVTLYENWENDKINIMKKGLELKFKDPELAKKLMSTGGNEIIEGNYWHDNFWGDCGCYKCRGVYGKNFLGRLLMSLRDHLHEDEEKQEELL